MSDAVISESLGLSLENLPDDAVEHTELIPKDVAVGDIVVSAPDVVTEVEKNFDTAEANIKALIDQSKEIVEQVTSVAKESETARIFEVAARLLEASSSLNKDLIDITLQKQNIGLDNDKVEEEAQTVNNNLFLSTDEMSEKMKELIEMAAQKNE